MDIHSGGVPQRGHDRRNSGEELQVRARDQDDLERLRRSWFPKLGPTVIKSGRDYRCRAFCTHDQLGDALNRMAHAIDYSNFKNAVAKRHSSGPAPTSTPTCGLTAEPSRARRVHELDTQSQIAALVDRTSEYLERDLGVEGIWPASAKARYGGVIFNSRGEILLREPTNHYDGYVWTFPKGAPEIGDARGADCARESSRRPGVRPWIVGHLAPGSRGPRPAGWPTST